jgi:outer membrane protein OmpA-like peptidoglycan-associated protein
VSRALTRLQAIILGATVLAGIGLGAWGLFQVGERQRLWNDSFTLHVGFPRLQGVGVGTPVRVRGLEAGVVTAVDLPAADRPDEPLTLCLRLDRRFHPLVFADASACILQEGMVGSKVVEIDPGRSDRGPVADGARIASHGVPEMADLLKQTQELLAQVRDGQGTLGKLLKDDRAYAELVTALQQTRKLMESSQATALAIKQDADAIKRLPIVRSYVEDPTALLVRPTHEQHRQCLPAGALFDPGRAVLTDAGRGKLDELAEWLSGLKVKGSDVVVVSYADPKAEASPAAAQALTLKQSEAVCAYLKDRHKVHKLGLLRWRDVKPLGLGTGPPPVPEADLPPARVEILVFIPGQA